MGDNTGGGDTGGDKGGGGGDKGGGGSDTGSSEYGSGSNYQNTSPIGDNGGGGGGSIDYGMPDYGSSPDPTSYAPSQPDYGGLPPEITGGSSIPNLSDPGPVGGIPDLPQTGGGTNTWGALPESFLNANNSAPVAVGGVQSTGAANDYYGPSIDSFLNADSSTATGVTTGTPGVSGTSAAGIAAPSGVSAPIDFTSSNVDLNQPQNSGGTSQTQAVNAPGLLESLGLGRSSTGGGLGAVAAGAGLINNLINGNRPSQNQQALEYLAQQALQRQNEIRQQSQPYLDAASRATAEGEAMRNEGRGVQQQGRDIINTGQGILPTALNVQQQGQQQINQGQALTQYLNTGTLPEAYESQVQQGINAAITRVTANAASRGMPTDPSRNTTLAEEIRQIQARAPQMRMELAQGLANSGNQMINTGNSLLNNNAFGASQGTTNQGNQLLGNNLVTTGNATQQGGGATAQGMINNGLQATGLSSNIYQALLTNENQQNQQRGQAIANFAAALNNTPRNNSITVRAA